MVLINGDTYNLYSPDDSIEAIVIALKTRSIPAEDAVEQSLDAARWLLKHGAQMLYFKYCSTFDSTEKGNIGPVVDALMELLDAPCTLLCPSLPINGRTVKDGTLYVNGVPLSESSMRYHPLNPMVESRLDVLMTRQSRYSCLVIGSEICRASIDELTQRICDVSKHCCLIPDYTVDEDGVRLAEVYGHLPLLTGGSGLLEHLAHHFCSFSASGTEFECPCPEDKRRLILAGSCSEMTQKQTHAYLESGKKAIRIFPDKLLSGEQGAEDFFRCISQMDDDLLIYSTAAVEELCTEEVSDMLENLMGELAFYAQSQGIHRLIVAGGETSGAVIRRLNYGIFSIMGSVSPGVPAMHPLGSGNMLIVLKSGNFGDESFFLRALS